MGRRLISMRHRLGPSLDELIPKGCGEWWLKEIGRPEMGVPVMSSHRMPAVKAQGTGRPARMTIRYRSGLHNQCEWETLVEAGLFQDVEEHAGLNNGAVNPQHLGINHLDSDEWICWRTSWPSLTLATRSYCVWSWGVTGSCRWRIRRRYPSSPPLAAGGGSPQTDHARTDSRPGRFSWCALPPSTP